MALGIVLLQGARGLLFLMSEVPLYQHCRLCVQRRGEEQIWPRPIWACNRTSPLQNRNCEIVFSMVASVWYIGQGEGFLRRRSWVQARALQ